MRSIPPLLVLTPLLVLFFAPGLHAQPRVFTTCEAIADGLDSSVVSSSSAALRTFCRAAESTYAKAFGEEEATGTVFVDGEETAVQDISSEAGVAVTTSSVGGVPFTVIGGDDKRTLSGAERGVSTRPSTFRPNGSWFTIVSVDVRSTVSAVWSELSELESFLTIGLQGLITNTETTRGKVNVYLTNGGMVRFKEVGRDDDDLFLVVEISSVTDNVFPGFDFDGSRVYVQVLSQGFFVRSTNIELGWAPPPAFDIGGDLTVGVRLVESLLLEILANFEGEFGRRCEFGRNVRTVEGDCNSLDDPVRGAAGAALRRMGDNDPAYPRGDQSIPAGPLDINVREISNALFSMSPGSGILEEKAEALRRRCATTKTADGTTYQVCPFRAIRVTKKSGRRSLISYKGISYTDDEELVFQFKYRSCTVDILLRCSGETSVELADDPCGAKTNRFFDTVGCVRTPGKDEVLANSDGLTDLFFTFGQFVDHDFGLSPLSQISRDQPGFGRLGRREGSEEQFAIKIPEDDYHFDREEFEFDRTEFSKETPNSQVNLHSSYLDGSQIYGVDFQRSRVIRSFEKGKLELSKGDLPPFNRVKGPGALGAQVENGPNKDERFFVVGDARGNEQLLLLAMHIAFLREHNLVAEEVAEAFPDFDDELIYQTARAIVVAEYQCIIYSEWLPLLLGLTAPDPRDFKYDEDLDATVSAIFTTSAFRFGHSLVGTNLLRMGPGSRKNAEMALIPIRDVFFQPEQISLFGIDPFLRGGAWHLCKEMDNKVVDELRNFLVIDFEEGEKDPPRFDLVSLNLQRGRDMGLPSFNDIRELFGLKRYLAISDFVKDPNLADLAEQVYEGDIDKVDSFFGGVVEDHIAKSQLGQTFNTIITDQFTRSRSASLTWLVLSDDTDFHHRDGDRFFYTGLTFDPVLIKRIPRVQDILDHKITLRDIILRTTDITEAELGRRKSVFQL